MAGSKTMTGARALVSISNPTTGFNKVVGIFNNVSWGLQFDAQGVHILGRYSPAEIAYTGQEPIGITAQAWRVLDHGPHADGNMPHLQDLLRADYVQFTIVDRDTDETVAVIHDVRPTSFTTSLSERQLQSMQLTFLGLMASDESGAQSEDSTAADLP